MNFANYSWQFLIEKNSHEPLIRLSESWLDTLKISANRVKAKYAW